MGSDDLSFDGRRPNQESDDRRSIDTETDCAAVEALIPAFCLNAADPEEVEFILARLAECPNAVKALAEYTALAQAMLYSAPETAAPAQVADQLRAAIAPPGRAPVQRATPTLWDRLRMWVATRTWSGAQIAVVAALIGLVLINIFLFARIRTLQQTQSTLLRLILTDQTTQQQTTLALLAAGELQTLTLPPAQENSAAHASVLWRPDADIAVLYAKDFPPLPSDLVYQLWLVKDGERASGGLFTVDDRGSGTLIVSLPAPLETFDAMGITPEPAGGSPGPTAPPVVRAQF